jgi:hypothetical protein
VAQTISIDTSAPGTPFSPGVRGQAVPAVNITRTQTWVGRVKALEVAKGSSIRGVYGGLEADIQNWKTRNNDARRTTLEYLKDARDYNADLFITANIRGLVQPDPNGGQMFYDTSIATLSQLAGDWVRYTNRIAQIYRQGDIIVDPNDQRILNELQWSSATAGDNWPTLLAPGDAPVPKVKYWEIGNEPRVGLSAYNVTNSYTFLAPPRSADATHKIDYLDRYKALTGVIKPQDSTIKVGPCLQGPLNSTGDFSITEREIFDSIAKRQPDSTFLPLDFISYHPYQKMGDLSAPADITAYLQNVYNVQKNARDVIRNALTADGRDPNSVELVTSEQNVSNFTYNETVKEAQMAHALGEVETVFSFARLGIRASHYWLYPAGNDDGTEYPVYKAYAGLRDHMGDTLLNVYSSGSVRLYTTRNSKTGEIDLWGMNFDNSTDGSVEVALAGLSGNEIKSLLRLGALSGPTSLTSSNLATFMTGGPTHDVDWTTAPLANADLSNYHFTLPASTISVLVIQPVPEPGALAAAGFLVLCSRRRRR